jgi:hypothetical protein
MNTIENALAHSVVKSLSQSMPDWVGTRPPELKPG